MLAGHWSRRFAMIPRATRSGFEPTMVESNVVRTVGNQGASSSSGCYQDRIRHLGESIEMLPSGWLRLKVCAGCDPVSGKRHYLDEVGEGLGRLRQQASW
jgi:hypothetical protein